MTRSSNNLKAHCQYLPRAILHSVSRRWRVTSIGLSRFQVYQYLAISPHISKRWDINVRHFVWNCIIISVLWWVYWIPHDQVFAGSQGAGVEKTKKWEILFIFLSLDCVATCEIGLFLSFSWRWYYPSQDCGFRAELNKHSSVYFLSILYEMLSDCGVCRADLSLIAP